MAPTPPVTMVLQYSNKFCCKGFGFSTNATEIITNKQIPVMARVAIKTILKWGEDVEVVEGIVPLIRG